MSKRIMLVDDEPLILKGLQYTLEQEGYEVISALDGEEALNMFFADPCDLILLDVMLPKLDGMQVCQKIRERSNVPIIMLTAKGDDMNKILGLEYGADDYIPKPFNILEVKARIKAILRRSGYSNPAPSKESHVIHIKDLDVYPGKRQATLYGEELKLTAREFELLMLFVTHPGKVYNREEVLDALWSEERTEKDVRTVDVHIRRLREKIETDTAHPEYIFTKWGVGYYFTDH
ncbi:MAG: response regulator transcription factor [Clostridia bacterium]|nr:response regulator transcription factor [Clostridia bacterium]